MCSFLFTYSIKITSVYNLHEIIDPTRFISYKRRLIHHAFDTGGSIVELPLIITLIK
nr:MAG TPA: hypothetical protein [Caudoviricetes sp.]